VLSFLQAFKDIPRNAYYIATKVGRYEKDPKKMFDFTREKTLESVDHSLKLLGLDYVDIIQVGLYTPATDLQKRL
jgi:aryl-alcohol dehydrogenase-like predicted oxidoreductase